MNSRQLADKPVTQILLDKDLAQLCEAKTAQHLKRTQRSDASRSIGIDGRVFQFGPSMQRGIGHYTINHLTALFKLKPEWKFNILFEEYSRSDAVDRLNVFPNVKIGSFDDVGAKYDMFHITDPVSAIPLYDSGFLLYPEGPFSVVFYDLIPYLYPKSHYSWWHPVTQIGYRRRIERLKGDDVAVLAISEHTKRDLVDHFHVPAKNITSILAGVNRSDFGAQVDDDAVQAVLSKFNLDKPFFLVVGALDAHKNFAATVNAFMSVRGLKDIELVVVGAKDDPTKDYWRKELTDNGVTGVAFTGYLSRAELNAMYAKASGLIFPSHYEGFGFPVLEAMAHGCPVITSNSSSIPEVAGDACILVGPDDIGGIARGMLNLASNEDLRKDMIQRGYKQAQKFSWEKTAQATVQAWESLWARRSRTQGLSASVTVEL